MDSSEGSVCRRGLRVRIETRSGFRSRSRCGALCQSHSAEVRTLRQDEPNSASAQGTTARTTARAIIIIIIIIITEPECDKDLLYKINEERKNLDLSSDL